MADNYTKKLEDVIKQMLKPIKGIPLNLVLENISGKKVIPFDKENQADLDLIAKLSSVAESAGKAINKKGILRSRPNEVGNDVEQFVKDALNNHGLSASCPVCKNGKKQSMGYPDIEFIDENGRANYLECKTYNIENIFTTQRAFYLSPTENSKVSKDAHHFLLSYEIIISKRVKRMSLYKCVLWKLLDIQKLDVDVKYEFQSDNKRIYTKEFILAEGII